MFTEPYPLSQLLLASTVIKRRTWALQRDSGKIRPVAASCSPP
jgi:hypothetical protein